MQEPRRDEKAPSRPPRPAGAPHVFEEAYLRFAPRLRKVAMTKFGIRQEDAEGLVQDVFATFFMHAANVEQVERYLIGAICNASRKHLQRGDPAVAVCAEHPCMATPGDGVLRQIERKQLLARVFARIGSRCRDLLRRYYVRGDTTAAIANDLESTPGSVLVNLHKCRRRAMNAYRSITGTDRG
jgi:RNA polymerase sigma factor (sigma-70 family)